MSTRAQAQSDWQQRSLSPSWFTQDGNQADDFSITCSQSLQSFNSDQHPSNQAQAFHSFGDTTRSSPSGNHLKSQDQNKGRSNQASLTHNYPSFGLASDNLNIPQTSQIEVDHYANAASRIFGPEPLDQVANDSPDIELKELDQKEEKRREINSETREMEAAAAAANHPSSPKLESFGMEDRAKSQRREKNKGRQASESVEGERIIKKRRLENSSLQEGEEEEPSPDSSSNSNLSLPVSENPSAKSQRELEEEEFESIQNEFIRDGAEDDEDPNPNQNQKRNQNQFEKEEVAKEQNDADRGLGQGGLAPDIDQRDDGEEENASSSELDLSSAPTGSKGSPAQNLAEESQHNQESNGSSIELQSLSSPIEEKETSKEEEEEEEEKKQKQKEKDKSSQTPTHSSSPKNNVKTKSNQSKKQNGQNSIPNQCEFCEKSFVRKSDLTRHVRTHTGERPFKCNWPGCDKDFVQKSALTVHSRVHSGEKPYSCDHKNCHRSFADSSSLARHKRSHTGNKAHVCKDCGKSFTRKGGLKSHEKLHSEGRVEKEQKKDAGNRAKGKGKQDKGKAKAKEKGKDRDEQIRDGGEGHSRSGQVDEEGEETSHSEEDDDEEEAEEEEEGTRRNESQVSAQPGYEEWTNLNPRDQNQSDQRSHDADENDTLSNINQESNRSQEMLMNALRSGSTRANRSASINAAMTLALGASSSNHFANFDHQNALPMPSADSSNASNHHNPSPISDVFEFLHNHEPSSASTNTHAFDSLPVRPDQVTTTATPQSDEMRATLLRAQNRASMAYLEQQTSNSSNDPVQAYSSNFDAHEALARLSAAAVEAASDSHPTHEIPNQSQNQNETQHQHQHQLGSRPELDLTTTTSIPTSSIVTPTSAPTSLNPIEDPSSADSILNLPNHHDHNHDDGQDHQQQVASIDPSPNPSSLNYERFDEAQLLLNAAMSPVMNSSSPMVNTPDRNEDAFLPLPNLGHPSSGNPLTPSRLSKGDGSL